MPNAPRSNDDPRRSDFAPWEWDTVQASVRAFVRAHGPFRWQSEEDLQQEALQHWWRRRERYNPARRASERTFMKRVIKNLLRDLWRKEQAKKHALDREAGSLDVSPAGEDGAPLHAFIADPSERARPEPAAEQEETAERIRRARSRLNARQRQLVDGLEEGRTITEMSRRTGRSRPALYDDRRRIQAIFREEGLRREGPTLS